MASNNPKISPRWRQNSPRKLQDGPNSAQHEVRQCKNYTKGVQKPIRNACRVIFDSFCFLLFWEPRAVRDPPEAVQMPPRPADLLKSRPKRAKIRPKAAQSRPKAAQGPSRDAQIVQKSAAPLGVPGVETQPSRCLCLLLQSLCQLCPICIVI